MRNFVPIEIRKYQKSSIVSKISVPIITVSYIVLTLVTRRTSVGLNSQHQVPLELLAQSKKSFLAVNRLRWIKLPPCFEAAEVLVLDSRDRRTGIMKQESNTSHRRNWISKTVSHQFRIWRLTKSFPTKALI